MEKKNKINEVNVKSEQVEEVLQRIPHWLIRSGTTVIAFIIILFFFISWYVQYPDIIPARVVITTPSPPISLIAEESGKLLEINVIENEVVDQGQIVAIIKNSALNKDVLKLISFIDSVGNINTRDSLNMTFDLTLKLGSVQLNYFNFIDAYNNLKYFRLYDPIKKEIEFLQDKIIENKNLLKKQKSQKKISDRDLFLSKKTYDRNLILYQREVISLSELEKNEQDLLLTKKSNKSVDLAITNVNIGLIELEEKLISLSVSQEKESSKLEIKLNETFDHLYYSLKDWEKKYVIKSPIRGQISLFDYRSNNQFINKGEEFAVVIPEENQNIIGRALIPILNSGKVKVGDNVIIKLDGYLYQEFGSVRGNISSISLVPRESMYLLEIELPNGLVTNYKKHIEFKQEMEGTADVVTEDLRLLERIFYKLRKILNK